MAPLQLRLLESIHSLRAFAGPWDDLWQRSEVALPTARAELLALWFEQFAPSSRLCGLVVERDGHPLAALPLMSGRLARFLQVGVLPGNAWSPAADLLVDQENNAEVLDFLVHQLQRLGWPFLWFDGALLEAPRWQAFCGALDRAGLQSLRHERFRVGQVDIGASWPAYYASRSRNHRNHLRASYKKAISQGNVELKIYRDVAEWDLEPLLRRGFEVEDRSWKGRAGSSVLRSPGMFDFYLQQARHLAAWGQLELVFLECNGRAIAFEYGWRAKGAYQSLKVGYEEAYRQLTPGQLLRRKLLERLHADPTCRLVDYLGPISEATARWSTRDYGVYRLLVAAARPWSRALLGLYSRWRPPSICASQSTSETARLSVSTVTARNAG